MGRYTTTLITIGVREADSVELFMDFLFQLVLLALVFGLSAWLLTDQVMDMPIYMITLGNWL